MSYALKVATAVCMRLSCIAASMMLFACSSSEPGRCINSDSAAVEIPSLPADSDMTFLLVPLEERPGIYPDPAPEEWPQDRTGLPMFEYRGRLHYHPLILARRISKELNLYRATQDSARLEGARRAAAKLQELGLWSDGAFYLPFDFAYRLHGKEEDTTPKRWFHAMAQGEALQAYSRLYAVTQEAEHMEARDGLFESFLLAKIESSAPWTACIDNRGYYWAEEYAVEEGTQVLNGFIFAVYGLYEYWAHTTDERALALGAAAMTTIKDHLDEYRVAGEPSYYCLVHRWQSKKYHRFHVGLLSHLGQLTGQQAFADASALFESDFE